MEEIDLKRLAKTASNKKLVIILLLIISVALGYIYSFYYVTPKYKSSVTMVLAQIAQRNDDETNSITQTDITLNKNLVDTYGEIIKQNAILNEVIDNLGLENTEPKDLLKMITVVAKNNTEMLKIEVSNEDASLARDIANEIGKSFTNKVTQIYGINNVYVIDNAEIPSEPYNVNHLKDLAIFFLIGLFVSAGIVLLVYMFDTTIKEESDVEEQVGLPVIGTIPLLDMDDSKKKEKLKKGERKTAENIDAPTNEAFRTLRTNITFGKNASQLKNILVTSCFTAEGKSYIASNLAIALARSNKKVLLIDADMRKGRQHKIFRTDNSKGLSNCIQETQNVNINSIAKYIKETKVPNLHLITSGERSSNPSEMISSHKMIRILSILNQYYDIVIIDGTPSILVADSIALSKFVKNVITVVSYRSTKIESLGRLKKSFENVGTHISGVVLNKYPIEESSYGEKYYYTDGERRIKEDDSKKKVQTVQELIREVQSNNPMVDFKATYNERVAEEDEDEEEDDEEETSTAIVEKKESKVPVSAEGNEYLYMKIENISKEVEGIKNIFLQYVMNNKQVTKEDIDSLRNELNMLKDQLTKQDTSDVTREIQEEIASIKDATTEILEDQAKNKEKIKKFLDEYKNRKNSYL